jgi:hypothetical protein
MEGHTRCRAEKDLVPRPSSLKINDYISPLKMKIFYYFYNEQDIS